ncbi:GspH/FimT family protein [Candidatus Foliamicus sp.]
MRGFTLMEILVALAVATVAALLAQPTIATGMLNVQRSTTINGLIRSLHLARRSAAERGKATIVCASSDGRQCSSAENWDSGWIVHDDAHPAAPYAPTPGSILYRSRVGAGLAISANRTQFVFRPFRGRSTNGTLIVCDRRGSAEARAVIVNNIGRPRAARTTAGGETLVCPAG